MSEAIRVEFPNGTSDEVIAAVRAHFQRIAIDGINVVEVSPLTVLIVRLDRARKEREEALHRATQARHDWEIASNALQNVVNRHRIGVWNCRQELMMRMPVEVSFPRLQAEPELREAMEIEATCDDRDEIARLKRVSDNAHVELETATMRYDILRAEIATHAQASLQPLKNLG